MAMQHSMDVIVHQTWNVVAYSTQTKIESGWKELPEMVVLQQKIAKVYRVFERDVLSGYIVQKEHTGVGELGAFFVEMDEDDKTALIDLIQKVWSKPSNWNEARFQFTHVYSESKETYTLFSKQMRENFGNAISATGLLDRYAGTVLKNKQTHPAEIAQQNDVSSIVPTDWQPMLKR